MKSCLLAVNKVELKYKGCWMTVIFMHTEYDYRQFRAAMIICMN